jgi:hypothetical protein
MELIELVVTFLVGAFASVILVNVPGYLKNLSKPENKGKLKFDLNRFLGVAVVGGIASVLLSLNIGLDSMEPYLEIAGITAPVLFLLKALTNFMKTETKYL